VKTALEDYRISDFDEIQRYATTILKSIPEKKFEKCCEQGNTDPLEVLLHNIAGNYSVSSVALRGNWRNLINTPQNSSKVRSFMKVTYISHM
jgi:hypothetical protein